MQAKHKGVLQMLLCALLWSMAGVMFKYIPWHPMAIAGARAFFAGLTLLAYILLRRLPFIVNRHTVLTGAVMAICCTLFVLGNKMTTAANAIVLQYTAPVFLLLFSSLFLRKRFRRMDVAAVLFTLFGIGLFFFDQMDAGKLAGNLISIASGAAMGLMYMCMGEAKGAERFSGILICEIFCSLVGLPFLAVGDVEFSFLPVFLIVVLGIFQLGLPYILYALASESCPALACSLIAALEPLVNPLWVLLFYGERPGVFALLGGSVVIATITLWCVLGDCEKAETEHGTTGEPAGKSE